MSIWKFPKHSTSNSASLTVIWWNATDQDDNIPVRFCIRQQPACAVSNLDPIIFIYTSTLSFKGRKKRDEMQSRVERALTFTLLTTK